MWRYQRLLLTAGAGLTIGLLLAMYYRERNAFPPVERTAAFRPLPVSADSTIRTEYSRYVVVLRASCGVCSSGEFRRELGQLRSLAEQQATLSGRILRFVAVGADGNWRRSFKLVEELGPFDEVSVGGGWINAEALSAFWHGTDAEPVVPQVLVIEELIEARPDWIAVVRSDTVARLRGLAQIATWRKAAEK